MVTKPWKPAFLPASASHVNNLQEHDSTFHRATSTLERDIHTSPATRCTTAHNCLYPTSVPSLTACLPTRASEGPLPEAIDSARRRPGYRHNHTFHETHSNCSLVDRFRNSWSKQAIRGPLINQKLCSNRLLPNSSFNLLLRPHMQPTFQRGEH